MEKQNLRHRVFYKSLPKIELHRHLEGSLRLTTMLEIARENDLDLPYQDVDSFRKMVQVLDGEPLTHQNFLSKFQVLRYLYRSEEIIRRITTEAIADAAEDNIHYMELRFTPVALTRVSDFSMQYAIEWVADAAEKASSLYGVKTRLIASFNRHESYELADEVTQLAIDYNSAGIVGLDVAGAEDGFPAKPFAPLFDKARNEGLYISIHAGEWGNVTNVVEAIQELKADRIGHGILVMQDPAAVNLAREAGTCFEVCVTSNYQSGVVPSLEAHPLMKMIDAGLNVTINSDDPSISQIDLSDEYELACENLGLQLPQLRQCLINAAEAAFLPDEERGILRKAISREFETSSRRGTHQP
ncbi:MAG: adenosine deaminase [Anaerolineales bacterium]|nr:adenosine deaminase [Anaerolineales bacterium]